MNADKDLFSFIYLSDLKYIDFRHLVIHSNFAIVFVFLQTVESTDELRYMGQMFMRKNHKTSLILFSVC